MRHLIIAAAAVAITALFVAPVSAERIQGGPIKQNGKCWKHFGAGSDATFGTWIACPAPAAAPAAAPGARKRT
jgi:hypothetical protein